MSDKGGLRRHVLVDSKKQFLLATRFKCVHRPRLGLCIILHCNQHPCRLRGKDRVLVCGRDNLTRWKSSSVASSTVLKQRKTTAYLPSRRIAHPGKGPSYFAQLTVSNRKSAPMRRQPAKTKNGQKNRKRVAVVKAVRVQESQRGHHAAMRYGVASMNA